MGALLWKNRCHYKKKHQRTHSLFPLLSLFPSLLSSHFHQDTIKMYPLKLGWKSWQEIKWARVLVSDCLSPELWKDTCLPFKPPSLQYFISAPGCRFHLRYKHYFIYSSFWEGNVEDNFDLVSALPSIAALE